MRYPCDAELHENFIKPVMIVCLFFGSSWKIAKIKCKKITMTPTLNSVPIFQWLQFSYEIYLGKQGYNLIWASFHVEIESKPIWSVMFLAFLWKVHRTSTKIRRKVCTLGANSNRWTQWSITNPMLQSCKCVLEQSLPFMILIFKSSSLLK